MSTDIWSAEITNEHKAANVLYGNCVSAGVTVLGFDKRDELKYGGPGFYVQGDDDIYRVVITPDTEGEVTK